MSAAPPPDPDQNYAYDSGPGVARITQTYDPKGTPSTFYDGTQYVNTPPSAPAWTDPTGRGLTQSQYSSLVNNFDEQKDTLWGTTRDAIGSGAGEYELGISKFLGDTRAGQRGIDTSAVNNLLARQQGTQGILGMVGRGIRSAGVMLGNRNAGDSSAAGAFARAYGDVGRRQMAGIGNQYEMGERDIGLKQQSLDEQRLAGTREINQGKRRIVNGIVSEFTSKMAQLDADMANAKLPDRINIEAEKNRLKQEVLRKLSEYDNMLKEQSARIKPSSFDTRRAEANRLFSAGTDLGEGAFDFTDQVPAQFQGGPFSSELPLFLQPRRREE